LPNNVLISTDPPYYDNIGYADLSDFFYIWLRRALADVYPDLFGTLLVPKQAELVATPFRFGGNKQKASIGRWVGEHSKARLFLFDEPTQGLDVGAREEVYNLVRKLAESGAGIVVASSELDEVLGLAQGLVVIRGGETVPVASRERTPEMVLSTAT
jgi:ABC-type sugar transport system ATPase subunit